MAFDTEEIVVVAVAAAGIEVVQGDIVLGFVGIVEFAAELG